MTIDVLWISGCTDASTVIMCSLHLDAVRRTGAWSYWRSIRLSDIDKQIKVGELLVLTGVVSSGDITEAIQVSKRLQMPIGRVLTMSGCVSEEILQATLECQPLVREGLVPVDSAISALKEVYEKGTSLEQALETVDCHLTHGSGGSANLADLLVDSNIVSQQQMDQALRVSFESGMPLGSALVLQGALSAAFFPSILSVQEQLKDSQVSRDEATEALKSAFLVWLKAEESLRNERTIDAEPGLPLAFERRLEGQAVHEKGESEPEPLLKLPNRSDEIQAVPSTESQSSQPGDERRNEQASTFRVLDLLKMSGYVKQGDLQRKYEELLEDSMRSAFFFCDLGLIDERTRRNAARCHSLLRRGKISEKQAVFALKQCQTNDLELRDVLRSMKEKEGLAHEPLETEPADEEGIPMSRRLAAGLVGSSVAVVGGLAYAALRKVLKR